MRFISAPRLSQSQKALGRPSSWSSPNFAFPRRSTAAGSGGACYLIAGEQAPLDASFGLTTIERRREGANQMTWITRHVLAIGMAILPVLFPASNSIAQQCTGSRDCPFPQMCLPGFFGGYCDFAPCNDDTECRNGSVCEFGFCYAACRHNSDCSRGQVCNNIYRVCLPRYPPTTTRAGAAPLLY